ncbi:fimbria/pilus periplasmic chaperone [Klebsiella oxytoca]|nr:fimbria/pilus periplasmic chaperone [Klebsiella oxytoca]MCW9445980.1 fimbria/pilus periplasmic chaperone [Klebsiella oxytoca]
MLINWLLVFLALPVFLPVIAHAISVGDMTFSMAPDAEFVAKRVVNHNKTARLYGVSVIGIDRPGGNEIRSRPADGELLFAPRQFTLQAGMQEYFKFYYRGPQDNRERYYRVVFREIPTLDTLKRNKAGARISLEPVVVVDTILVVRPRQVNFKWSFDKSAGTVTNTGNTWFRLLARREVNDREEDGESWYLRPGDTVKHTILRHDGDKYIIYNDKFIKLTN